MWRKNCEKTGFSVPERAGEKMENELFEHAPVPKAYFTMALPVVMGMVVNLVYNIVDTFFIARTQNAQLVAGVSLCEPIFTLRSLQVTT